MDYETNLNTNQENISKYKPLLWIWIKPRKTIRYIVDSNPKQFVILIAMIGGIFEALGRAAENNYGDQMSLLNILLISIIVGSISGIFSLYIFGVLLNLTGTWIGGNAHYDEVLAASAWGMVPTVTISLALFVPELFFFGNDLYTSEMVHIGSSPFLSTLLVIIGLIGVVGIIWSFVIGLITLSEVQGFSAWKALGNVLLAVLILIIPTFILIMLFV